MLALVNACKLAGLFIYYLFSWFKLLISHLRCPIIYIIFFLVLEVQPSVIAVATARLGLQPGAAFQCRVAQLTQLISSHKTVSIHCMNRVLIPYPSHPSMLHNFRESFILQCVPHPLIYLILPKLLPYFMSYFVLYIIKQEGQNTRADWWRCAFL